MYIDSKVLMSLAFSMNQPVYREEKEEEDNRTRSIQMHKSICVDLSLPSVSVKKNAFIFLMK